MVGGLDAGSDSVAGIVDTAINFDGSNDNINIADHNDLDFAFNEDFTVSTWVKIPTNQNDTLSGDNSIIEKWSVGGAGYPYVIRFQNQTHADPGYIYCARYDGTNNPVIKSTFTLNDNNYHHIACVKNAGIISLYIDGVLDGTTPDTTTGTTTNSSSLYFGQRGTPSNRYTGSIDDVRIYNRALSLAEIGELYALKNNCATPMTNLIGHWKLDETSGAVITDSSGNSNNGTWSDGSGDNVAEETITGQDGTALNFDGSNDYINMGNINSFNTLSAMTLSLWVNADNWVYGNDNWINLIGKRVAGGTGPFAMRIDANNAVGSANKIIFFIRKSDGTYSDAVLDSILNTNQWYHIIGTWDGTNIKLYVDGALQADTGSISGPIESSTEPFRIGAGRTALPEYFNGKIDDVRIYDRSLTATEIEQLYGSTGGTCTSHTCSSPLGFMGELIYNADYNVMQYCDGANWVAMGRQGDGGAGCSNPTGLEAEMRYDGDLNTVQYCEGDEWVSVIAQNALSIPTAGLVGHWTLDETSGAVITDSSGEGNDGAWVDNTGDDVTEETVAGKVNNAIDFSDPDDLISAPVPAMTSYTYSAWIYTSSYSNDGDTDDDLGSFFIDRTTVTPSIASIKAFSNKFSHQYRDNANLGIGALSGGGITLNQWQHVVWGRDLGTEMFIYVDGIKYSTTDSGLGALTPPDILMGRHATNTIADSFILDDVRIYNRALSTNEVKALYLGTK